MRDYLKNKKLILLIALGLFLLVIIIFIVWFFNKPALKNTGVFDPKTFKGVIIDDVVKVPDTLQVAPNEGEVVARGEYSVKLRPQSEKDQVYITKAKLSLKEAYNFTKEAALAWSSDQKLIFIRSNGALGLDGKASSWQIAYGSAKKRKAYEIIIEADKVISEKEVDTQNFGQETPLNWYDSNEAIASLPNLAQFTFDTVSAISFYYSQAAESWAYGLATGSGQKTTSMWVK
jgi:hypothetical protein